MQAESVYGGSESSSISRGMDDAVAARIAEREPMPARLALVQLALAILTEATLADIARQTGGTYQRLHVDNDLSSAIAPAWSLPADDTVGGTVLASVSRVLLLIALLVLGADTALGVARNRSSRYT